MSLLIAAALLLLPARVTIHARAQPLGTLLPTVSAQIGRPLAFDKALEGEWLVIEANEVYPSALLDRIAEVTHAKWVTEGENIRLRRLPEDERVLQAAERKFHFENLQRQWKEAIKEPYRLSTIAQRFQRLLQHPEERVYRETSALLKSTPPNRYLPELLLELPFDDLWRLKDGESLVFSDRPRGLQRPLPASAAPVVKRLFQDYEAFTSLIDLKELWKVTYVLEERDPGVPPRAVLEVTPRRETPGGYRLHARLALKDAGGDTVLSAGEEYWPDDSIAYGPAKGPVAFSPLTREMESFLGETWEDPSRIPTSSSPAVQAILNPERDGRLTRLWSDVMFAFAALEKRPLVANLSDAKESSGLHEFGESNTIDRYLARLGGTEIRREGGWLTLRPRFPGPIGRGRSDRRTIGTIVRRGYEGRSIGLEEASDLVARLDSHDWAMHWRLLLTDKIDGGAATASVLSDRFGLEVLHHLGPEGRRTLFQGRPVRFAALSRPLQEVIRGFFTGYGYRADFSFDPDDESGRPDSEWSERLSAESIAASTLSGKSSETLAFITRSSPTAPDRYVSSAERLVGYLDDDLRLPPSETEDVTQARFRAITQQTIELEFGFPNGDRHRVTLIGYRVDPQSPFLPLDKLPAPLRAHLRKLKDAEPRDE